jgi:uncharacterized protein (TIGR02099 family)
MHGMIRFWLALAALLRWSLGLCALALVLAALYVSLGRQLLPLVAEYRSEAEIHLAQTLGMPVDIATLEGHWSGFSPVLTARDLRLGKGPQGVAIKQIRLVPDLLASLMNGQLRIAELQLDGLRLQLQQNEQGDWRLVGWPQRTNQAPLEIVGLLRQSQRIGRISLLNSQLSVQAWQRPALSLSEVELSLSNGLSAQRMDARLRLPDGQPLALQLRSHMQPEHWQATRVEFYLRLPQSDWASWLPPAFTDEWRLANLQLGGELWGLWEQRQLQRMVARLHAPQVAGHYRAREPVVLQDLALNAYFTRSDEGFQLLLDDLAFSREQTRWGEARIALRYRQREALRPAQWQLSADRLELGPLLPLVERLAPVADNLHELLQRLQPHGGLRNLRAEWRPELPGAQRLRFSANLERIGFSAWHASPAVENASGSIRGDLGQGEVRLDSEDFALHLTTLFPRPWLYRQATGRLTWTRDDEGLTLRAPYLQVVGEEGSMAGDFLIRLHQDPEQEDYMDLRVGLRDGDARFTEKYLPTPALKPALDEWLKTAIRGGKIEEGYFQYQGSIQRNAEPSARSISLFFAVQDAELAYQPGWPALYDARAEVLVENSGVRVRVAEGRILESRVTDVKADIGQVKTGRTPHLRLHARLASSVADGLKILQQAPLGTSAEFAGWNGSGALNGALSLDLPLQKGEAAKVVVDFRADQAALNIAKPALALSDIRGDFRYDTSRGLSAPSVSARALGHGLRGRVLAEGQPGKVRSTLLLDGVVKLNDLVAWLGVQQPLPARGSLPYSLRLSLQGADSQLSVQSDLEGLSIDLPAPFGKAAHELRDTHWRMSFGGSEQRYWLDYAELASLGFAAAPGRFEQGRGELRLNDGPAILPPSRGLRLRGRLPQVDLGQWQSALEPYRTAGGGHTLLREAQLRIAHFTGFGQTLEALDVDLRPVEAGWALLLDSPRVKGRVELFEQAGRADIVALEYLRLPELSAKPAEATEPEAPDALADFDPRRFPALDLRIAHVFLGDDDMGAWSLQARPDAQGVVFSALDIQLKGLQMDGSLGWQGAPGKTRSWYKGRLQGGQLAEVLSAWGYAASASSEHFHVDAEGQWPGSPAGFSLKRYTGVLDASLRKGQFVEVQGSAQALRIFGLLNFNSIGRRLRLDFSDLLGKGLSYDRVKVRLEGSDGIFVTREPLTLTGPSSNLELNGTLNMVTQDINAKLLVTLPVTNNLPIAALIVGAPAIGGALFIADKLLGDRIARFASVQYDVKGSLHDPQLSFDKPFEKPN